MNYYDDVELGIRVWARGWRVAVCGDAWVDHVRAAPSMPQSCRAPAARERHRIRTALKYFPTAQLLAWLLQEARLVAHLRRARAARPAAAWAWNLRLLGSALRIRRRFAAGAKSFWPLLDAAWAATAERRDQSRLPARSGGDGPAPATRRRADAAQLNFGWYAPERDGQKRIRPTAAVASAFLRFRRRSRPASPAGAGRPAMRRR